jgi:hypothetical protein
MEEGLSQGALGVCYAWNYQHFVQTIERICAGSQRCFQEAAPLLSIRCDDDDLRDIYIGIPFLIFSIPVLKDTIFCLLYEPDVDEITSSQESFAP